MRCFELVSVQVALAEMCFPVSHEWGKKHHMQAGWGSQVWQLAQPWLLLGAQ